MVDPANMGMRIWSSGSYEDTEADDGLKRVERSPDVSYYLKSQPNGTWLKTYRYSNSRCCVTDEKMIDRSR